MQMERHLLETRSPRRSRLRTGFIPGALSFMLACSGCGDCPVAPPPPAAPPDRLPAVEATGAVALPPGSPVRSSEMTILSVTAQAAASDAGSFVVEAPKDVHSFVYVLDAADNLIGATYAIPGTG